MPGICGMPAVSLPIFSCEVASARQEFEVPRGAMHSFTASRNKLAWLLRVSVALPGWPDVNEEYPLTVLADWVR